MTCTEYWAEAKNRYRAFDRSWIDCTEEFYDEMLGVVPPHYPEDHRGGPFGYCFAVGECWDHTDFGEPIYLCLRAKPGFACRLATLGEFEHELRTAICA